VLPAYEPAQPAYGATTDPTLTTPVAGPLTGEDGLGSASAYGDEYGRQVGNDRI
jgi:hypothetical protein